MPLDIVIELHMDKDLKNRIQKRRIAFVYLLHRMFEGNYAMMLRIMGLPGINEKDLQSWDEDYKEAVMQTIQEEDSRGVKLHEPQEVPSIRSIKEKILRRMDAVVLATDDPSRLATAYKIISEYQETDDKKDKSVLDAINESILPLTPKKKAALTMVEKMNKENKISIHGKRGVGRPRKADEEELKPMFPIGDEAEPEAPAVEGGSVEEEMEE